MRILALDVSLNCGMAVLETCENKLPKLIAYDTVHLGQTVFQISNHYPTNYYRAVNIQAQKILDLVTQHNPDVIVIEQINRSKNRYSQQILDWLHYSFLNSLTTVYPKYVSDKLFYIDSSQWRKVIGIQLSKEDKKRNTTLSKAKTAARKTGSKLDKKSLGINGKINKKHLAVRWVNDNYGLSLKFKDNDACEAICQGIAYSWGASTCDGR